MLKISGLIYKANFDAINSLMKDFFKNYNCEYTHRYRLLGSQVVCIAGNWLEFHLNSFTNDRQWPEGGLENIMIDIELDYSNLHFLSVFSDVLNENGIVYEMAYEKLNADGSPSNQEVVFKSVNYDYFMEHIYPTRLRH